MHPDELAKIWKLRKAMNELNVIEIMELLKSKIGKAKNNIEFLMTIDSDK